MAYSACKMVAMSEKKKPRTGRIDTGHPVSLAQVMRNDAATSAAMARIRREIGISYSEQVRRALRAWCAAQLKGR